jgi:nucleotide-binding universal stress UspA family protein
MAGTVICGVDRSLGARYVVQAAAVVAQGLRARLLLAFSEDSGAVPLRRATRVRHASGETHGEIATEDLLTEHVSVADTDVALLAGDLGSGLCRLAERGPATLIVVGARDRGLLGSLTGSVSATVIRQAQCPVMVVPDVSLDDIERPVVDGATVVCGVARRSDLHVAGLAGRLASGLGMRLRLAHVLPSPAGRPLGVLPDSRDATALLRSLADELLMLHPELGDRLDWRLREGRPGQVLAELASTSRAAAVVIGTDGGRAVNSATRRSPASILTRAAAVPVIVSRDDTAVL